MRLLTYVSLHIMSSTYGKECIIEEWTRIFISNFCFLRVRTAGSCSVIVLFSNWEGIHTNSSYLHRYTFFKDISLCNMIKQPMNGPI
jgi:hypothetical protein